MLVSAKEMLEKAKAGKYAVGQFNINNLEWTKAVLLTAQELQSPVILGVSDPNIILTPDLNGNALTNLSNIGSDHLLTLSTLQEALLRYRRS